MADNISIKVDAHRALLKFQRVPPGVRDQLRIALPSLTNQLAAVVDANMASGLKSRSRLLTKRELHETPREIYGKVSVVWTGASTDPFSVPKILEEGRGPVVPKTAKALRMEIGGQVIFRMFSKAVAGVYFMRNAFNQMRPQIVADLRAAVKKSASEAKP